MNAMNPKVDFFFNKANQWQEEFETEKDHSWRRSVPGAVATGSMFSTRYS